MFRVSSHTISPFLNGIKFDFRHSIILVRASLCAANASSRFLIRVFIFSSIVGNFVFSNERGIATGVSSRISSNGVFFLSACLLFMCVNSRVERESSQSSG